MERFFLKVYGCQMNQYEAGVVSAILEQAGYARTGNERQADILLMLTCAVRSHAEQRALGRLAAFRALRSQEPGRLIGVLGCVSQNLRKALLTDLGADIALGPDQYRRLPEMIRLVRETGCPQSAFDQTAECYDGIVPRPTHPVCAQLTIMRGCNNFCSYCIVPYTRGRERSKPAAQVLLEATALARQGIKDLTLLGQNVLVYRDNGTGFVALLKQVATIPGIARLRFLTSHPKDLTPELLTGLAQIPKACPSLHLPVQSGSDRILGLMNRGYTRAEYQAGVNLARKLLPGLSLTTDLMVGFPSETETDFQETLALVRETRFDFAYMFRFSLRPGTKAAELKPKVPEAEAGRRLATLIEVQNQITREQNSELVNRIHEVLVESPGPRGGMLGRTRTNKPVIVPGRFEVGDMLDCRVARVQGWTPVAETGTAAPAAAR